MGHRFCLIDWVELSLQADRIVSVPGAFAFRFVGIFDLLKKLLR